jgi:hypothetical protein
MWNLVSVHLHAVLVSIHLEIVLILMLDRCMVCAKRTIGSKIILTHSMVLLGDEGQVKARFNPSIDSVSVGVR